VAGLSTHHFVGFIQNHDQVGNRAIGDRREQIVGIERAKVGAAIVLTSPFIPLLFQGEEFAASTPFQYFADHTDPEMAKAVSEGRKREFAAFGWKAEDVPDPERLETFLRSKLNWDEVGQGKHAEMMDWYLRLIRLRHRSASLNDGDPAHVKVQYDEAGRWLRMDRGLVTVLCNLGEDRVEFERPKGATLALASYGDIIEHENSVILPQNRVAIFSGESSDELQ
jgi:maltooligosyltrehalose trehalohydrolase